MSKLREQVVSNCEKKFLLKCLSEFRRLDGRSFSEFRDLKIEFGKDWGSCHVSLGETQVLAQVSCEIQTPKSTRPSEGILYINIELNPLAAPHFEPGRQSDLQVQLNRILEKCIKDSRAVDLESLCVKVKEKVWALRVDVNVLNHEGNILDCASIAALSALKHFRRPDVTCDGENVIVHTYAQRDSIPTVLHHYPVCTSFAIISNGDVILADPTLLEEAVADAYLMIGLNGYKELCGFYLGGNASMPPDLILKATSKAAARAATVIEQIKESLAQDESKRQSNKLVGFEHSLHFNKEIGLARETLTACLDKWNKPSKRKSKQGVKEEVEMDLEPAEVHSIGKDSAVLIPPVNKTNQWNISSDESEEDEPESVEVKQVTEKDGMDVDSDGSEEEKVVVLNADKKTNKKKRKHV